MVSCNPAPSNGQHNKDTLPAKVAPPLPAKDTNCEFTLGFDAWEPYQYKVIGDQVSGLDIELVEAVVNEICCRLVFEQGTWVSLLAKLKAGDVDILLGASKTAAREEFALFSDA